MYNVRNWRNPSDKYGYLNDNQLQVFGGSNYPLYSLPKKIYQAAADVQAITQAPAEMIVAQFLAVGATAIQGLYDVELPHGQRVPPSFNMITLGLSGERKSTVIQLVARPLMDFERKIAHRIEVANKEISDAYDIWQIKGKSLSKTLEKTTAKGGSTAFIETELKNHLASEPLLHKGARILYRDTTPAALKKALDENHPFGLVLSDEAGSFFSGHMVREFQLLNDLWCGTDLIVDRVSSGNFHVPSPRMSLALMLQPDLFQTTKEKYPLELRDSGLFARFLICYPQSTQGSRFNSLETPDTKGLEAFHSRINELLERTFPDGGTHLAGRQCLTFSHGAKLSLRRLGEQIESELAPGGRFVQMQDFASKMLEHICRLAALFHVIGNKPGFEIDDADVQDAYKLIEWHAQEFYRLVVHSMMPTQEQRDADLLHNWFVNRLPTHGSQSYGLSDLRRIGPNPLRGADRLKSALNILRTQNKVWASILPPKSLRGRPKLVYGLLLPVAHGVNYGI